MKKGNFTSIPFPPRRLSLGSEWARPYPILGILQERSGAPELLLAWTDPDVVRRGRLPFRFCSWIQPCPRPLELRHADGTVSRLRTKPSRFPFSRRRPFMVGGNHRRSNVSIKTRPVSHQEKKTSLRPRTRRRLARCPIAICSITMRSLHLSTGSAHRHPHPHSGAEGRAPEKDNFLVWLLRWHAGRLAIVEGPG